MNPRAPSSRPPIALSCFALVCLMAVTARAQTSFIWTNTAGAWTTANNWTNFPPAGSSAPLAGGSNDYVLSFLKAGTYAATNNLAAPSFTLNRLVFSNAAVTLAGSNLFFAAAGTGGALPQILQNSATAVVINASLTLGTNLTFGGVGGGTMTVGGAMGGAGSITKTSTNNLTLNGTNTFVGNLLVAGGTLQAPGDAALGAGGNTITVSNAILRGSSSFTLGASRTISIMGGTTGTLNNLVLDQPTQLAGSGRLQVLGNAVVLQLLTNQVNYTGDTILIVGSSGTAYLRAPLAVVSNYHLIINAGVYEGMGPTLFTWTNAPGGGAGTFESMTSGVAGWSAYNGRMVVNLGGATGQAATVNGAGLNVGNNSGLLLGGPNANDVTEFVNPLSVGSGRTFTVYDNAATNTDMGVISGALSGGGTITKDQLGTLWLTATSAHTGGLILRGGALRANDGVGLNTNELLTIGGGVLEGDGAGSFTRALGSGANQVDLRGGGGFSAYGGKLTVNLSGGIPLVWSNAAGYTPFFLTNGAALVLGSVSADSEVELQNALDLGGGARTIAVLDNAFSGGDFATLTGAITNGTLIKTNSGVLVLKGVNTYAGGTTNLGGALALGAENALGGGTLVMAGGGVQSSDGTSRTVTNALGYTANAIFGAAGTGDLLFTIATNNLGGARALAVSNSLTVFSGVTTNAALTKAGPGTLVLGTAFLTNIVLSANGGVLEIRDGRSTLGSGTTGSFGDNSVLLLSSNAVLSVEGAVRRDFRFQKLGAQMVISNSAKLLLNQTPGADFQLNETTGLSNAVTVTSGGQFVATNFTGSFLLGATGGEGRFNVVNGGVFLGPTNSGITVGNVASSTRNRVLVSDSGSVWSNSSLTVGNNGSENQFILTNGATATIGSGLSLGSGIAGISNLALVDGSLLRAGQTVTVGSAGSYNQLLVTHGGQVVAGAAVTIGSSVSSTGNLVQVIGPGSSIASVGSMTIGGDAGAVGNILVISNGGAVYSGGNSYLGKLKGAPLGQVLLAGGGSIWTNATLYFAGQSNLMQVLDGAVMQGFNTFVGETTAGSISSNNTVVVANGGAWTNLGSLYVGAFGNGNRFFATNGATVHVAGDASVGYLNATPNAGGQIITNNQLLVSGAGSTMTVGGILTVGANNQSNYAGIGFVAVNDGARLAAGSIHVSPRAPSPNCAIEISGTGTLVQAGVFYVGRDGFVSTGIGGLARVLDGAVLEVADLRTGASSNTITNSGGVFQFTLNSPTIVAGSAGSIVASDATLAFRDTADVNVKGNWGVGAGQALANITFAGDNAFRLDNSSTTNAGQDYVFDTGRGATNYTRLEMVNGTTLWQGGSLTVGTGGAMLVSNTAATVSSAFTNQGSVRVVNGTLSLGQPLLVAGNASLTLINATNLLDGGLVISSNGFYGGSGRVESGAGASSFGTISPGNSPGTLVFSSNLTLLSSSLLVFELGGTNSSDYDHLFVEGILTKGGSVLVTNLGYTFLGGESFDFIDAAGLGGSFASLGLPTLSGGMTWDTSLFEGQGILSVVAVPEPSPFLALGAGVALLVFLRRRA